MTDFLVFYPNKPTISEKSLKEILTNHIINMQMWDDDIPVPWIRYKIPIKDTKYLPLAMPTNEMFGDLSDVESNGLIETANIFGYEAYFKN